MCGLYKEVKREYIGERIVNVQVLSHFPLNANAHRLPSFFHSVFDYVFIGLQKQTLIIRVMQKLSFENQRSLEKSEKDSTTSSTSMIFVR